MIRLKYDPPYDEQYLVTFMYQNKATGYFEPVEIRVYGKDKDSHDTVEKEIRRCYPNEIMNLKVVYQ